MMRKLKIYEAKVKKVFILQALPLSTNIQKVEDRRIKNGKSIDGYMEETIKADATSMRIRVVELAKHCEKCVIYDLMPHHMDNGRFMMLNPITRLNYFERGGHHTLLGTSQMHYLKFT
ncbi:hypothetical protein PENTCL1PPCAC_29820, partial [Pristionchus entomophagus]